MSRIFSAGFSPQVFKSDIRREGDPMSPWEQDFVLRAPIKGAK